MAINRFRRILYEPNTEYLPEYQVGFNPDLSGLESTLRGLQTEYDQYSNIPLPNYLRNSPTDVEAFKGYKNTVEGLRESAKEAFRNQRFNEGINSLKTLKDTLIKARQPDGEHYELERGVTEYNKALKDLQDTFLDRKSKLYNPYIFKYSKDKLDSGIDPFKDPTTNNYRTGISGPNIPRYIPQDEVLDYYDKILDNIKADQVVYGNNVPSSIAGMSFKTLLQRGEKEYIDPKKVARILLNATTPEIAQSYGLLGEAMGLPDNQGESFDYNKQELKPTMLGNFIKSLIDSKVYTKYTDKSQVISDSFGEQRSLKSLNVLYTGSEGRLTAGPDFSMKKMDERLGNLDGSISALESRINSETNPLSSEELLSLDKLRTQRNILETTKNSYQNSYFETPKGRESVSHGVSTIFKKNNDKLANELRNLGVSEKDLTAYITKEKEIPSDLINATITLDPNYNNPYAKYSRYRGKGPQSFHQVVEGLRAIWDENITSHAKNNEISLSANVISAYNISGEESDNLAAGAGKLLTDLVTKKGGAFTVAGEDTTIDKFMEDKNITTDEYNISVGILDKRIGGEKAYYFKATPKKEYGKKHTSYEQYIVPNYDLGLEKQLGIGLMQDALAKNGIINYKENPALDLDNTISWTSNSKELYDIGRQKYAESILGDSFKDISNLEQNGIMIPNQTYDIYLPGQIPGQSEPTKITKTKERVVSSTGTPYVGTKFKAEITLPDGLVITKEANSIYDLKVELIK